jgi:beta-glucosidase
LLAAVGHVTGKEAKALGYTNIYAPILDMARDPRWGRVVENFSEDPYLTSELAVAMSQAMQAEQIVSTPKHFAVYGVPEGGRDGHARTAPHVTPRELETIYLAPFRAVFTRAHALGVMSSYNDYDGVPITGSWEFLTHKLRQEWGFQGYVVSDSRAVGFLWSKHHVAGTYKEAVRQAVQAGLNVRTDFTPPSDFILPLRELVREGKVSMKTIDNRVRDVLRVKFWLGLFDHPYIAHPKQGDRIVHCPKHVALSLKASRESLILLKNKNHLLPLRKDLKTILVTGPNANEAHLVSGKYGTVNVTLTTVLEGIRKEVSSKTNVLYTKGCDIVDKNWPRSELFPMEPTSEAATEIQKAVSLARQAEAAIVVLGENRRIVGESRSRTSLNLPGFQRNLVQAVVATGTPTVVVLINGRALTINWIAQHVPAILEAWFPGEQGGTAIAEALFGDVNPGGKLPVTFPKTVGEIPMAFPHAPASWAPGRTRISGVLFPFGFGLSYTQFRYAHLKIAPASQGPEGQIQVSADVTNTGDRAGDEVVQLYLNDVVSSVVTPEKVLRGFRRVHLRPGETQKVTFTLGPQDLALLNRNNKWVVEPGRFDVMLGSSSEDIRLRGHFEIVN